MQPKILTAPWQLALIVLAGACLRLYRLDEQSLWSDEALSVVVSRAPLDHIIGSFTSTASQGSFEFNPPVYSYLLHGWFALFGVGGFQARLLSAIAGILSLPLMFLLGQRLHDTGTGLRAALLLALSQLGIMYSQEARNYEVFLLLSLCTVYFYQKAHTQGSLRSWCYCTTCAVLMVATNYYGALTIVALAVCTALYWRTIPRSWVAGAAAAGSVTIVPWCWFVLADQLYAASASTQPPWFAVGPWTLVSTINRFNNGAVMGLLESAARWTFLVGAVTFVGPMTFMLIRSARTFDGSDADERRAVVFVSLLWTMPLLIVIALGALYGVQFAPRYVAFCIAPYYLLVAAGMSRLRGRTLRAFSLAAAVCYSGYALKANYFLPYKENYRDAIALVASDPRTSDCVAFVPFQPLSWSIYTTFSPRRLLSPDQRYPSTTECPRIWVLTYQRVDAGQGRWHTWLSAATKGFQKPVDRQFFWVHVERFDASQAVSGPIATASVER